MEKSFFFNAVVTDGVADRTYSAEDIALRESMLLSDGVVGGDSLTPVGGGGSFIYLGAGAAVISGYTYLNTATLAVDIDPGDDTYPRIDTLCIKLDLTSRKMYAVVTMGYPAADPAPYVPDPTASAKYLPICRITVPAGGAPVVETEDIEDIRVTAGFASLKTDLEAIVREHLGEIDPFDKAETEKMRLAASIVDNTCGGDTVLCGDGTYRSVPMYRRAVAVTYQNPGEYTFDPAEYPSADGLYDIEVQGAGGGGGSHNGEGIRGGGGGGGAYVTMSRVPIESAKKIIVGAGGEGVPGGPGGDGGYSAFDGLIADGGLGGGGGILAFGGAGATGMWRGEAGADGIPGTDGFIYTSCGKGGGSKYGAGADSVPGKATAAGNDASFPGAGGSGGTAAVGTFSMAGGKGGDGIVTVYRYVSAAGEVAE